MLAKTLSRSLFRAVTAAATKRPILQSTRTATRKVTMGDPIEHATGLEKRELLAQLAGNDDPWGFNKCLQGTGTKQDPVQIPSAYDARLVGCLCNEEASYHQYFWLYENEPKRCECGRWFCLVHVEAFG